MARLSPVDFLIEPLPKRSLKGKRRSNPMNLEDRVKRLEDLYDPMFHREEMILAYLEKADKLLTKLLSTTAKFAFNIESQIRQLRDFLKIVDDDMQTHYEGHYQRKKAKKKEEPKGAVPL